MKTTTVTLEDTNISRFGTGMRERAPVEVVEKQPVTVQLDLEKISAINSEGLAAENGETLKECNVPGSFPIPMRSHHINDSLMENSSHPKSATEALKEDLFKNQESTFQRVSPQAKKGNTSLRKWKKTARLGKDSEISIGSPLGKRVMNCNIEDDNFVSKK